MYSPKKDWFLIKRNPGPGVVNATDSWKLAPEKSPG
jgi:hypothetical protein